MSKNTASALIMFGLLVAFGGVGGVENSISDADFLGALGVAVVGVMIMWVGTLGLRVADLYENDHS